MATVLVTAFEPYGDWETNASWLALVELTKSLPSQPRLTTRLYPVDFAAVEDKLTADLAADYDYVIHLGQAPGRTCIQLEAIAVNVAGNGDAEENRLLVENGPVAYRTSLALTAWAAKLRQHNIPVQLSYHAGTYLCNAAMYLTHYIVQQNGLKTQSAFVHLPLDCSQVCDRAVEFASLPKAVSARAIQLILEDLVKERERA